MLNSADVFAMTCRGRKPGPNQDAVLADGRVLSSGRACAETDVPVCAAAADGVSGDAGGEIASRTALEAICGTAPRTPEECVELLERANRSVQETGARTAGMKNMCTTISAVWVYPDAIFWCTRGDTPIYFATDRRIPQISHPHTDIGGRLTSYLGADARVTLGSTDCALVTHGLEKIRAVLILSDGISKSLRPTDLRSLMLARDMQPQSAALALMKHAWNAGSRDNMSVVFIRPLRGGAPDGR